MKKQYFTLVEILVVIAILSILITMTIMGVGAVQESSKIKTIETFMNRVISSTDAFAADAGVFPWPAGSDVDVIDPNSNASDLDLYKEFFSVLAYRNYGGKRNLKDLNKRQKAFLVLDDSFESKDYELKDVWGNYYVLWYDGETSEEVDHLNESQEMRAKRMPVKFGIISLGADRKFDNKTRKDYKKFFYWDGLGGDIPSWKKPKQTDQQN